MNTETLNIVSDAEARKRALDIEQSFIVQAPAGSGKTELLTQRILKLLSVSEQPEEILAITFTKKAASEMRTRITEALQKARKLKEEFSEIDLKKHLETLAPHQNLNTSLSLAALEQNQRNNWNLLDNINRLQLKTIDSFCSSIVFQLPILSALGGQGNVEENAEELFDAASSAFLDSLEGEHPWSPALTRVLEYFGTRNEQLKPFLIALLNRRLQWADLILDFKTNAQQGSHQALKQHMEAATCDILNIHFERLRACHAYSLLPELERLARFAASNVEEANKLFCLKDFSHKASLNNDTLENWIALTQLIFTIKGTVREQIDKRSGFPADKVAPFAENKKAMKTLLEEIKGHPDMIALLMDIPSLPPLSISEEEVNITADICECLHVLLAYLALEFQAKQGLDFSEIQFRAINSLADENNQSILLSLDSQIKHILIDEYQDTSQSQLSLLENLMSEWQHQEHGKTLFLVGDPMQSIYRFREADVGIFIQAQEHGVQKVQLEKLTLSCNFRSDKEIVEWNNEHFLASFPLTSDYQSGAVSYSPSQAFKVANKNKESVSYAHVNCNIEMLDPDREIADRNLPSLQWDHISQSILDLHNKQNNEKTDSVAVLVRSKSYAIELIKSFRAYGISYQAIEIDPLNQTPHILTLCNICAALINPEDKLAWFSLLRSAVIGLENIDLLKLEQHCQTNHTNIASLFIEGKALPGLSGNASLRIKTIQTFFAQAGIQLTNEPLSVVVDKLWLSLGGPCTIDDNQEKDVRVFFSLIRKLESEDTKLSSTQINKACEKLFAEQSSKDRNPVNIMSIHKAKGLEFDHVFIPSLDKRGRNDDKSLINWNIHKNQQGNPFLLLAPLQPKHIEDDKPSLYKYLEFLMKQQERNENIRLLYVACTRPKQSLHLYGQVKKSKDAEDDQSLSQPTSGSLLSLLWPSLKKEEINYLLPETNAPKFSNAAVIEESHGLKRIHHEWKNITLLNPEKANIEKKSINNENTVAHIFAAPQLSAVTGTIVHLALQQLTSVPKASRNLAALFNTLFQNQSKFWQQQIRKEGLHNEKDIQQVMENCSSLLQNAFSDKENHWIFDNELDDSQCEQSLFYQSDENIFEKIIVDRSFIKEGHRWIIDYKTSSPAKEQTISDFLEQESKQYREQLERYGKAYKQLENLPQQLSLYFPSIQTLHLMENTA